MARGNSKQTEKVLIDLINSSSNRNKCGECGATYPTWASPNLGVFLCGRCASLHRKLGDEVSIVKSLTLDKWDDVDLENMSSLGNKKNKKLWNPKDEPFPFDDDDKDELYQWLRNKYILGKFRYDEISKAEYHLGKHGRSAQSSRRDRFSIPKLTGRDIPEIERLKYRKLEPQLQDRGFNNIDDNYEALSLAKGDLGYAVEILSVSESFRAEEGPKPSLPKRPGQSQAPSQGTTTTQGTSAPASSSEWWSNSAPTPSSSTNGPPEPPQQFLDPATGIIYVDPVQQQQFEQSLAFYQQQQQQQLQQVQATGIQHQLTTATFPQYQQGGLQFQQQQQTGLDKNQLMSLYSTPTAASAPLQAAQFTQQTTQFTGFGQQQQPQLTVFGQQTPSGFGQPQQQHTGFTQRPEQTFYGQQQPQQQFDIQQWHQ